MALAPALVAVLVRTVADHAADDVWGELRHGGDDERVQSPEPLRRGSGSAVRNVSTSPLGAAGSALFVGFAAVFLPVLAAMQELLHQVSGVGRIFLMYAFTSTGAW